jgi:hypothetical protein
VRNSGTMRKRLGAAVDIGSKSNNFYLPSVGLLADWFPGQRLDRPTQNRVAPAKLSASRGKHTISARTSMSTDSKNGIYTLSH